MLQYVTRKKFSMSCTDVSWDYLETSCIQTLLSVVSNIPSYCSTSSVPLQNLLASLCSSLLCHHSTHIKVAYWQYINYWGTKCVGWAARYTPTKPLATSQYLFRACLLATQRLIWGTHEHVVVGSSPSTSPMPSSPGTKHPSSRTPT